MPREASNFSCSVVLPDGSSAEVRQTNIQLGKRQDMTFFVAVHSPSRTTFTGALRLSGSSLSHLDECSGDTREEKSARVTDALRAWVQEHGLLPDFHAGREGGVRNRTPARRVHLLWLGRARGSPGASVVPIHHLKG
jgi:hypothetical protein